MSVEVNVADTEFMGDIYTFIDCPGSNEFLCEAEGVLPAADCAVVVCEADPRKVPALQVILKRLTDAGIPHMMFLNKIDRAETGFYETLRMLQPASSLPLVLRQIPLWKDGAAVGFIDLALERAFAYRDHAPSALIDIPEEERPREVEARFAMLERLADHDDELMEELLGDIEPPRDQVFHDLVDEFRRGLICPVLFGSAFNGNGILRLLKALRHEAPGIDDVRVRLGCPDGDDAIAQVMKTTYAAHGGKLSIARVLCGSVTDGLTLTRSDGTQDRVSGLYRLTGQKTTKCDTARAGETVAIGKLEHARTGDTLSGGREPVAPLVDLQPGDPVMVTSVRAKERKDEAKLSPALAKSAEEDAGLVVGVSRETGETLLSGQGEMHLRVVMERLQGRFGLDIVRRTESVGYRETIRERTTVRGRHKKQSGGHGQFGDVLIDIEPAARGAGITFNDRITGGVVPKQYIPGVEAGARDQLKRGPLGFEVVDVTVTLTDGSFHTVDSSDQAFQSAARLAIREGHAELQAGSARTDRPDRGVLPLGYNGADQCHPFGAARPASRLRRPAGLDGMGRGRRVDPGVRGRRPDRGTPLGNAGRRQLPPALRPPAGTDRSPCRRCRQEQGGNARRLSCEGRRGTPSTGDLAATTKAHHSPMDQNAPPR